MFSRKFKANLIFYIQIILVWMLAFGMFYFFRQYGIDEFPYVDFNTPQNWVLHSSIHLGLGFVIGVLYATLELQFERSIFQRLTYGRLILIKGFTYIIMGIFLMATTIMVYQVFLYGEILWDKIGIWLTSITFLAGLLHLLLVSTLISFIRQLNRKCGPGILWNMIRGKYHHPREEERIFMFLDLKSSTTIAEKLGHIRFSSFIQDCFFDLTNAVLDNQAEIYQYVGDEVILSWDMAKGLSDNQCLKFYFDYKKILDSRKEYYELEYQTHPFFKAGIHLGKVTVAEVGVIKREISYYGDVLNTAARIQGRCNEFNHGLLVSEKLITQLGFPKTFVAKKMGVVLLRGKEKEVAIFGIEEKIGSPNLTPDDSLQSKSRL